MSLIDGFKRSFARHPDKAAVIAEGQRYTYSQLDTASNYLAFRLLEKGIARGDYAGVLMTKGMEAVSCFLACLKLGVAYVPLDYQDPPERLKRIIENCSLKAVLIKGQRSALPLENAILVPAFHEESALYEEGFSRPPPESLTDPQEVAYVLHTSGSTGIPKGIRITHRNICHFVDWTREIIGTNTSDIFGNHAPFYFDISTFDIYGCFEVGGTVVLSSEREMNNPSLLIRKIREHKITIWYSVPSILTRMVDHEEWTKIESLRCLIFAGEPYPVNKIEKLISTKKNRCALYNFYGPTETNVCTYYRVPPDYPVDKPFPIGKSIAEVVRTEVRDSELVVYGPCVMRGYLGEPDLKEERYATGDIVSLDEDDNLLFQGRKDSQIKIRGNRVELGEIENCMLKWEKVEAALVIPEMHEGDYYLRAHVQLKHVPLKDEEQKISLIELKSYCQRQLPVYMIPHYLTLWDRLPKNKNGKIDRAYLMSGRWKKDRGISPGN